MESLRRLQLILLDMIKDIDLLCQENGIDYYLVGGSALGAIRHKGFIPWDDDLDIAMTVENYTKFVKICREQLDSQKFYIQEGLIDWPMNFTKIKLRNTEFIEHGGYLNPTGENGIFIDIFIFDNAPNYKIAQIWQFFCAKIRLSYMLAKRGYEDASFKKKTLMKLATLLDIKCINSFFRYQTDKYNHHITSHAGMFYSRFKFHNTILPKNILGKPKRVEFESIQLPVPQDYHAYLTFVFGNYMVLPPAEQRIGMHIIKIDFGKYL